MSGTRRPWRVRWWSQQFMEYHGKSYATETKATAQARWLLDEGFWDVEVWLSNPRGEVVGNKIMGEREILASKGSV